MPYYNYRALDASGRIVTGSLEALHEIDLAAKLARLELTLVRAKTRPQARSRRKRAWTRKERIQFFTQLEILTHAGVPLIDCLMDLGASESDSALGQYARLLAERITAGALLNEAAAGMPGVFTPVEVALLRAGETTGNLSEVFGEIARSLRWQDELAAQTKKLLMYPSFVLIVISGVVVFLMTYLVPQLVVFIKQIGGTLPFHTRLLIAVSEAFSRFWWLILPAPAAIAMLLALAARIDPRIRRMLHAAGLKFPRLGEIWFKLTIARFVDTLGVLYRAGIPIIEAIGHAREVVANLVLREAIAQAQNRIANGVGLTESFAASRVFPSMVLRMLRVGENTGQIDTALKNVTYFYSRDIDESIGRLQAMIEPTLTVAMGMILGWIMLSVLGPIYDTISKIKM